MVNDLFPSVRRETVKTQHFTGNAQFLWETLETSWGCQGSQGHVLDQHGPPEKCIQYISVCTHGVGKEVGKDKN